MDIFELREKMKKDLELLMDNYKAVEKQAKNAAQAVVIGSLEKESLTYSQLRQKLQSAFSSITDENIHDYLEELVDENKVSHEFCFEDGQNYFSVSS